MCVRACKGIAHRVRKKSWRGSVTALVRTRGVFAFFFMCKRGRTRRCKDWRVRMLVNIFCFAVHDYFLREGMRSIACVRVFEGGRREGRGAFPGPGVGVGWTGVTGVVAHGPK